MRMGAPRDERVYEEVGADTHKLTALLASYLDEYNLEHNAPLNLGGYSAACIKPPNTRQG